MNGRYGDAGYHTVRPTAPQCSQVTKPPCGWLVMTLLQLLQTISQWRAPVRSAAFVFAAAVAGRLEGRPLEGEVFAFG